MPKAWRCSKGRGRSSQEIFDVPDSSARKVFAQFLAPLSTRSPVFAQGHICGLCNFGLLACQAKGRGCVKLLAEPSATHPPSSDRKKRFMVLGESAKRFLPFAPKNK